MTPMTPEARAKKWLADGREFCGETEPCTPLAACSCAWRIPRLAAAIREAEAEAARAMRLAASDIAHEMRFDGHHISDAIDALPLPSEKQEKFGKPFGNPGATP